MSEKGRGRVGGPGGTHPVVTGGGRTGLGGEEKGRWSCLRAPIPCSSHRAGDQRASLLPCMSSQWVFPMVPSRCGEKSQLEHLESKVPGSSFSWKGPGKALWGRRGGE